MRATFSRVDDQDQGRGGDSGGRGFESIVDLDKPTSGWSGLEARFLSGRPRATGRRAFRGIAINGAASNVRFNCVAIGTWTKISSVRDRTLNCFLPSQPGFLPPSSSATRDRAAKCENARGSFTVARERGALLPRCRLRKYSRSFCALRDSMAGDPRRMNARICMYLTMREEQRATLEIKIVFSACIFSRVP